MLQETVCLMEEGIGHHRQTKYRFLSSSFMRFVLLTAVMMMFLVHILQDLYVVQNRTVFIRRKPVDPYSLKVQKNIRDALIDGEVQNADVPPLRKIGKEQFEVVPALQLSHCRILKSMSTVLTNLMCYIYNPEEFIQLNKSISTGLWEDRFCEPFNRADTWKDLERRLPFGYNNFAVVRDPLSRFVSGYLDQCLREQRCLGCDASELYCVLTNLKESLKKRAVFSEQMPYDHALVHLAPQSWYCNMSKVYESTTFIKYESGEKRIGMISEILDVLKEFGVSKEQIEYISNDLKSGSRTNHSTESWPNVEKTKNAIRMNATLYSIFMDIFQYDYKLFDFRSPY